MMLATAAVLTVSTAVVVTTASGMLDSSPAKIILAAAALLAALGAIAKALHLKDILAGQKALARLTPFFEEFATDWQGTPERPGVPEVPSMPERVARTEARTEKLQHEFATETTGRLILIEHALEVIQQSATSNGEAIDRLDVRVDGLDSRVTGHRNRQDETIQALGEHLAGRLDSLRAEVEAGRIDRQKLDAAIAILTELGFYSEP